MCQVHIKVRVTDLQLLLLVVGRLRGRVRQVEALLLGRALLIDPLLLGRVLLIGAMLLRRPLLIGAMLLRWTLLIAVLLLGRSMLIHELLLGEGYLVGELRGRKNLVKGVGVPVGELPLVVIELVLGHLALLVMIAGLLVPLRCWPLPVVKSVLHLVLVGDLPLRHLGNGLLQVADVVGLLGLQTVVDC